MSASYLITLGAMVAGIVQALSGFAFGMVALSFGCGGLNRVRPRP